MARNEPSRALLVLGGGMSEEGLGAESNARLERALGILGDRTLVLSGRWSRYHGPFEETEADLMADIARSRGVPDERIRIERESGDTVENMRFVAPMLEGFSDVEIVTSWFHASRVSFLAEKMLPVPFSLSTVYNAGDSDDLIREAFALMIAEESLPYEGAIVDIAKKRILPTVERMRKIAEELLDLTEESYEEIVRAQR